MSDETVDSSVRVQAAEALGELGDARLLSDLECTAQELPDENVRRAVLVAVEQIRRRLSGE